MATYHEVIIAIDRFTSGEDMTLAFLESARFAWTPETEKRVLVHLNRALLARVTEIQRTFESDIRICAKNQNSIRYALDRHRDQFVKLIKFTKLELFSAVTRDLMAQSLAVSTEKMRLQLRTVFSRNSEVSKSLSRYRFLDEPTSLHRETASEKIA